MKEFLSPKDLADAIGVSESSMKRWTDEGRIQCGRTTGGHRRIALHEAVRFVRAHRHRVHDPELLGIPELAKVAGIPVGAAGDEPFHRALVMDDAASARGVLFAQYLAGVSVAAICDGHVRGALSKIGEMWKHGESGVLVEHRATDICIQALNQLRSVLPPCPDDGLVAIGCAPQGDPYLLPSLMAATVLAEAGWRDFNLGPESPLATVLAAVENYKPKLVWYALSTVELPPHAAGDLNRISEVLEPRRGYLVVGGRGAQNAGVPMRDNVIQAGTMMELHAFAKGLNAARQMASSPSA